MNRIVRENFPVAELPESLKGGLPEDARVSVTIEPNQIRAEPSLEARRQLLDRLFREARPTFDGLDEIEAHVSALRQEWD